MMASSVRNALRTRMVHMMETKPMMTVAYHMLRMDKLQPDMWKHEKPRSKLSYRYARRNEAKGFRKEYRGDFGRRCRQDEIGYMRLHRRLYRIFNAEDVSRGLQS